MKRKSVAASQCPIARSLELVGDWWTILILRDAMHGLSRFDEFAQSLGIAPNILSGRLRLLVDKKVLERRRYSDRPVRYDYALTPLGEDFRPVVQALLAWGNQHLAPEGHSVVITDVLTGRQATPLMVDADTGLPLSNPRFQLTAGPAAGERTRWRLDAAARRELSSAPADDAAHAAGA